MTGVVNAASGRSFFTGIPNDDIVAQEQQRKALARRAAIDDFKRKMPMFVQQADRALAEQYPDADARATRVQQMVAALITRSGFSPEELDA